MRFTGQVRVPEVDHPGIPATIVVEDGLAEVLLEGESLGRWSLYDVHAARLVSSAFSISLDGEEITFIADEPVDFAYKGVEHMAGVWARYKAMTIPRRVVAVGRSRRGTTPSRIPELREAMLSNLRTAPPLPSQSSIVHDEPASDPGPSPWAARLDAYSNVPAPIEDVVEPDLETQEANSPEVVETVVEDAVVEMSDADEPVAELTDVDATGLANEAEPAHEPEPEPELSTDREAATLLPRMRPGPGLIPRQVTRIAPVPSSLSGEPLDWETAWEEPPSHEDSYEGPPPDADQVLVEEETGSDRTAAPTEEADAIDETVDETDGTIGVVEAPAPEQNDEAKEVVLDLGRLEIDQRVTEPVTEPAVDPVVEPAPGPAADQVAVAVADHPYPGEELLEPDLELLFAGAVPEGERSGLFGAVRSAFARNRAAVHEHEFVEAPGGIGIVRQICAECGYISIGVSD